MGKRYILWMICSFTRFIKGVVVKDKEAETIINAIQNGWNLNFGFPSRRYFADNGLEFQNEKMSEMANELNMKISFGPPY